MTWTAKDPDEILDYSWPVPLDAGDSVTTHTAVVKAGTISIASASVVGDVVRAYVTGGTDGTDCLVEMTATTVGGRRFEYTGQIRVIDSANAFEVSFRAAFPTFQTTPREAIAYWREQAERIVDARFGNDKDHALKLLTAHYLTMQGYGDSVEAQRISKFGGATDVKSGSLSLSWQSGDRAAASGFDATSYGKMLMPLIRLYAASPAVTDTGPVMHGNILGLGQHGFA
jgi:hypothetical protein